MTNNDLQNITQKTKDLQNITQKTKDLQNITQKTKDRATRTALERQIIYLTNRQKDKQ